MVEQKKSYSIYEHRLPEYFFRFPFLIRPVHWGHQLLHNRNRIVLRYLKNWISEKGGKMNVMDAGCGEGNYLIPLAHKFPKCTFTGLDYNPQLVKFVNHYSTQKSLKLSVKQADLNQNKLPGKYDLILCVAVLQMLKDDLSFLKQVKESLHPEGQIVLNVPISHTSIFSKRSSKGSTYNEVHGGVARKYTVDGLESVLDQAGFQVIQKIPTNGYWGTLGNELLNFGIDALQSGNVFRRSISAILFAFPLLPLVTFCNVLNSISGKKNISGIVVAARLKPVN